MSVFPRALFLALLILIPGAARADWQDELSPLAPGAFPAIRPMQLTFEGGWSGLTAAEITLEFSRPRPDLVQLYGKAATTGLARSLWRLDATHTAIASAATLRPMEAHQMEAYRSYTVHTDLAFDEAGVSRLRTSTADKSPARRKTFEYPGLFDLNSALLFVRSQKLQQGQTFRFVVYPATSLYLATVHVEGREKIKVKAGTYPAIRVDLKLQKVTSDLKLEPHTKFKRATGWLSDDEDRLPLRLNAQIFIGTVWVELVKVR